ncbi:glycosyltransferase family 4 protein [Microbacterium sp. AZCO]|uniref:glycosyltransferase family 4 protein n=1 Tax=Microbacterium sp. AZCO TaxID=3142976 RepID=UPI0031F45A09
MKIAIVSQYYPPEPVPIPASVAQGLVARGHDVTVVTGVPDYPGGILHEGYRNERREEVHAGIPVLRLPLRLSRPGDPLGRIGNYVSFGRASAAETARIRDVDAVYVYAPQMTAAIGPARWARRRGVPFVLHVQDLWPESITESGLLPRPVGMAASATLRPWLRGIYRDAAVTLAIGPRMARILVDRGVPEDRIRVVFNWAPDEPGPGTANDFPGAANDGTRVIFAGNLGIMQDLETIVRAAERVTDVPGLEIEVIGSGTQQEKLQSTLRDSSARNIRLLPRVSREEMAAVYRRSDYQLVTLKDSPVFAATIPSKLPSSLSRGVPVITAVGGDVSDLVRDSGAGFAARPSDPDSLAEALRRAATLPREAYLRMRTNAHDFYTSAMSMRAGIDTIEDALVTAARTSTSKGRP